MIPVLLVFSNQALLVLRVVVGLIFVAHGWPKLKNLKGTQAWFGSVGFKPGWLWGTLAALLEGVGGPLIIVGFGTQPFSFLLAIQMLVAAIWQKRQGKNFSGGYELDLLLVAALLVLAATGGGTISLEGYFRLI
ncbi:MAG: DoxX family protein [Candidatus Harrisonbacteria bacterium]|nr:DoxX family protein [Candidatus Harrisonbacteria bacterium]